MPTHPKSEYRLPGGATASRVRQWALRNLQISGIRLKQIFSFVLIEGDESGSVVLVSVRDKGGAIESGFAVMLARVRATPNRCELMAKTRPLVRLGRVESRAAWRIRIETACRAINVDPSFLDLLHPVNRRGSRCIGQEHDADHAAPASEASAEKQSSADKKPRSTSNEMRKTISRYMTGQTLCR
jgi:hypothetical protein